jgi:hypothetical protein
MGGQTKISITEEHIRERAYEIYLERGGGEGARWTIGCRRKSNSRSHTAARRHEERRSRCAQFRAP